MKENKAYVYIVKCSDDSYYTGYTVDLDERLKIHNLGKGAKYTRARLPVSFVFTHECESKSLAMSYEYKIKRLNRKEKEDLIKGIISLDQIF
ncbi:GIY-YIG nuclease family protein [Helcococcus massiliensis]|uniref:GIY-YIG nuclease family protein n=1 Tax=Helcococcus massiliensis TaxID=2040290 RepID=UPI000CDF2728|nr:GIY-YIG nuclease family protein [Helcococcus massiliensis]